MDTKTIALELFSRLRRLFKSASLKIFPINRPQNPLLTIMFLVLFMIFLVGYGLTFLLMFDISNIRGLGVRDICISKGCINNFIEYFKEPITIFNATTGLLVSFSTVGGILVALLSYLNSLTSSRLANHISHYKIFQDYVFLEISKYEKLSTRSFNIFKWYNRIFDRSRLGSTSLSRSYRRLVDQLNDEIERSNSHVESSSNEQFSYKQHQKSIKNILSNFGIIVEFAPRNDFFELETELFELISNVNREFCYSQLPELKERHYI